MIVSITLSNARPGNPETRTPVPPQAVTTAFAITIVPVSMLKQPRPFRTVIPETVCVPAPPKNAAVDVENTVERPFPSMIVEAAPAPAIVRVRKAEIPRLPRVRTYTPDGSEMLELTARTLASANAARSEHAPAAVAQTPSPGVASTSSTVVSTTNWASARVANHATAMSAITTRQ